MEGSDLYNCTESNEIGEVSYSAVVTVLGKYLKNKVKMEDIDLCNWAQLYEERITLSSG